MSSEALLFESETLLKQSLMLFAQTNADFDDCLIATCAQFSGCAITATIDRKAANSLGMELLP